ncbi:MAG: DMT family transporter [Candidatus Latescibacteria bacterium]|nr:DMT family transporter [Candidatus Latescibacterota bacterium]
MISLSKKCFGSADAAMVMTCFLWGLNAVISKNALGDTPETFRVYIYNGLRIPAGTLFLILTLKLTGDSMRIRIKHLPYIALLALVGMFMFMFTFILGITMTSSTNTGVINATIPIFILLTSFLFGIERPTIRTITGIGIGFLGMLTLSFRLNGLSINTGDLLLLVSCLCWAFHTVFGKRLLGFYSPVAATIWIYLFTSIYFIPLFCTQFKDQNWSSISLMNWFYLAVSSIGSIFLANSLYYFAIKKIGPTKVGVYTNLTPVFTLLLAVLIRGETVTITHITGLLLILTGIGISKSKNKKMTMQI